MVLHPEHQLGRSRIWGRDESSPLIQAFARTVSFCEKIDFRDNSDSELYGAYRTNALRRKKHAANPRAIRTSVSVPQPAVQLRRDRGRS